MDPLQLRYIQKLVETNFLSISEVLIALSKSSNAIFLPAATAFSNTEEEIHEARTSRELVEAGVILVLAGAARFQKPKSPEYIWTTLAAVSQWMDLSMGSTRSMKSREGVAELVIALGQNEDVIKVWSGSIGITANRGMLCLPRRGYQLTELIKICEALLPQLLPPSLRGSQQRLP